MLHRTQLFSLPLCLLPSFDTLLSSLDFECSSVRDSHFLLFLKDLSLVLVHDVHFAILFHSYGLEGHFHDLRDHLLRRLITAVI